MNKKIDRIVSYYGIVLQLRQAMEECAELIQALNKYLRVKDGNIRDMSEAEAIMKIAEEITDVLIMISQIIRHFNLEKEIEENFEYKINRVLERMEKIQ